METKSLKALSLQRLHGNMHGNMPETRGRFQGNIQETCKGNFDQMEQEYFTLLAAWWKLDVDPESMSMDEARRLVDRLDELYQALQRSGRKVPVRLSRKG